MRVQEGKGLDIKPPDLGEGGGLALVAPMDGAPVVIQRVGASIQEEKNTLMHRSATWSQAAALSPAHPSWRSRHTECRDTG